MCDQSNLELTISVTRSPLHGTISILNSVYSVVEIVRGYNYTLNKSVEVDDPPSP
jgi:hypothetical protein